MAAAVAPTDPLPVLRDMLPGHGKEVDDAVLSYMAEMLNDRAMGLEDLQGSLGPLLLDTGLLQEDQTDDFVARLVARLRGEGKATTNGACAPVEDDAPRRLETPVIMLEKLQALEKLVGNLLRSELKQDLFTNKLINTWSDPASAKDEILDEASMRAKAKQEKKLEKQERRGLQREQSAALQRNEIMERLTRAPVVLHQNGQFGEYLGSGPADIVLQNITMELGGLVMLDGASVTFAYGRRYGLVGRNGIGKTTFLKHLAAKIFDGIPKHLQILHIEQEVNGSDDSVLQTVLKCDVEREALLTEERSINESPDPDAGATRLMDIYRRLEEIDASSAPARASEILAGLGFTPAMQERSTKEFSGGWRMRVSLALALFICPDVLLLDEPTNHLDLHAVLWLEDYLLNWKKMVIIVSHARDFLDAVVTDIVHVNNKKLTRFKGDYTNFEERRAEEATLRSKAIENQDRQLAHMQSFVDRFRASAARASMAQSRLKAMSKIERLAPVTDDPTIVFNFPDPEPLATSNAIQLIDVTFGYDSNGPPLFSGVDLTISTTSRICLVGPNGTNQLPFLKCVAEGQTTPEEATKPKLPGVGKSTLLKVIFGELEPLRGYVTRQNALRVERFTQHHVDQLNLKKSPLEMFRTDWPNDPVQKVRSHLGSMGITGKLALQPIYTLSGGQKSRVALAKVTYTQPHLLLLDEPTNHLDLDTVQALIRGLASFSGAVFIVSHDEHMITAVCDELWVVEPGRVYSFPGDFEDYKKLVRRKQAKA